jgi:hypothetical protein
MRTFLRQIGPTVVAVGLCVAVIAGLVALPKPLGFGSQVTIDGQPTFLAGVNYPYKSEEDFGSGAWGYSGVAQSTTNLEIDTDFSNLEASGVRVIKWRLFNDGRYSPVFNARGYATGVSDHFYDDLDAALALARKHNLYIVFSLFDSGLWTTSCSLDGVQTGGHADTLTTADKRQALLDNAIVPTLKHIGHDDRVLGFEIIAEPEWGVTQLNQQQDNRIKVPLDDVRSFVGQIAAAVHLYTSGFATLESNRASNMTYWRGLGLDYYSFSWYDWLQPWEPLDRPAATFGLDRPIILGEFPSYGSPHYSLPQVFDIALRQGYAGALAWSYGNADQYTNWSQSANPFLTWMRGHWASTFVGTEASVPSAPVDLLRPPFQVSNVKVTTSGGAPSIQADIAVANAGNYQIQWFIYDTTSNPGSPASDQAVQFGDGPNQVALQLGNLLAGHTYKVSLGVFDSSFHLQKWFDGVAVLKLQQGTPKLQTAAVEDPCGVEIQAN